MIFTPFAPGPDPLEEKDLQLHLGLAI